MASVGAGALVAQDGTLPVSENVTHQAPPDIAHMIQGLSQSFKITPEASEQTQRIQQMISSFVKDKMQLATGDQPISENETDNIQWAFQLIEMYKDVMKEADNSVVELRKNIKIMR